MTNKNGTIDVVMENVNGVIEKMECDDCPENDNNLDNKEVTLRDSRSYELLMNMTKNREYIFRELNNITLEDINKFKTFPEFIGQYKNIIQGIAFLKYDNLGYIHESVLDKEKYDNHEIRMRHELLVREKKILSEEIRMCDTMNNDAFKLYKTLVKELNLNEDEISYEIQCTPETFTVSELINILQKHLNERKGAANTLEINETYLSTLKSFYEGRLAANSEKKAINCQIKKLVRNYSKSLKVSSKDK
uniref:RNA polymerase sigma factor, sigma-70 family n=1 Tax=Strongyloides papillosus TaxID=174720 RepID=A0A0N5BGK3_STREA